MPVRISCQSARVALLALGVMNPAYADGRDIVIAIIGGRFVPNEVPVPAGQKVKLIVRNQDQTMSEFASTVLHREKTVGPGGEIAVFVGPLSAGTYEFFDDFHAGNRGRLIVK